MKRNVIKSKADVEALEYNSRIMHVYDIIE